MLNNVTYKEDGSIEIDNNELLKGRADISLEESEPNTFKGDKAGLGGLEGEEENKLKNDKRGFWNEPGSMEVMHVCPICNTKFKGRTNRVYCTTKCKELGKKRRQRQRTKDIKGFKPYRGKTGEVYFLVKVDDIKTISFIPAINAESRAKARKYLETQFGDTEDINTIERYREQINTVIKNE